MAAGHARAVSGICVIWVHLILKAVAQSMLFSGSVCIQAAATHHSQLASCPEDCGAGSGTGTQVCGVVLFKHASSDSSRPRVRLAGDSRLESVVDSCVACSAAIRKVRLSHGVVTATQARTLGRS